jgi:hypothetical protein
MAVIRIKDVSPPELNSTLQGGTTVSRQLIAVCSGHTDSVLSVAAHTDCPQKGDAYSYYADSASGLTCTGLSIRARSDNGGQATGKAFDIQATYSDNVSTGQLGDDADNPMDDPPSVEFDFTVRQRPALVDIDGKVVENGAGEPFDPPHMVDEYLPTVTITRNEPSISPSFVVEYNNTVNSDMFAGVDPGKAKMFVTARKATRGEYEYWVVTYEIVFRDLPWNPTGLLAIGTKYRRAPHKNPEIYIDPKTNSQPASPIYLKLDGTRNLTLNEQRIAAGLPESDENDSDAHTPYVHEFNFYRSKAFGPLNLGV